MGSLTDYIDWRGDLRFSEVELCEVDSLILSLISYIPFDGIVPGIDDDGSVTLLQAMRVIAKQNKGNKKPSFGKFLTPELFSLAVRAAKSKRFGGIRASAYVNDIDDERQSQFSAMTFRITKDKYFVVFRGTDDTLVGWKESFNMSFMKTIPSQIAAAHYFERVAYSVDGKIYSGGHSKGGNLAVYAAAKASDAVKNKIITVYNNDGPGFDREFMSSKEYASVQGRVRTLVPQSSVVGMLLEHEENYEVIKSNASGLMQHTGHTWDVMGGSFIHLDTVTEDSKLIDTKLKEWLNALTLEERERFMDNLYDAVSSLNATTLTELTAERVKLIKAWNGLDQKTKNLLLKCVAILIKHNALGLKKK